MSALCALFVFVLHVGLHGSPERTDVPLAKARGTSALDQLQEEGVLSENRLGEHLEQIPVRAGETVCVSGILLLPPLPPVKECICCCLSY